MQRLLIALVGLTLLVLPGCASVLMTAAGVAGSIGLNQAIDGRIDRTFTASVDDVLIATLHSLGDMELKVTDEGANERGWSISAAATSRTIDIDLEPLSKATTRMRVVTYKEGVFMDRATSSEIVAQTARRLTRVSTGTARR